MAENEPGNEPLAIRALSRMRGDILSLQLAPGEVTSERALEQLYGVSRTPIREALKALIGEGLVVRAERGYAIAPFDLDQLEEIFEYREVVEDAAVRLACQRRTEDELDAINATIDRGLSEFTPDSWFEAGLDFHVQLAALSGNRFLREGVQDAVNRTIRARWLVASSEASRIEAHREHSEIISLVRERREDDAAEAVRRHGREVHRQIVEALEASRRLFGARGFASSKG
ncbi:GntR family transcriptional regulator [Nitratireductor basaltis]|uniref:GntR family transcriptional regulator n=1 Tax=Nitratireductor basaltis TaxID=472175 RepID=A0A084U8J9_9HYPH|nr:GntR family transcriptional regulator [Nitratireductor basaltis]KFB09285.1 GntR family transcriptional regulator [Nitratireductor basaltis]